MSVKLLYPGFISSSGTEHPHYRKTIYVLELKNSPWPNGRCY